LNLRKGGDGGDIFSHSDNPDEIRKHKRGWFQRFTELEKETYRSNMRAAIEKWRIENPDRFKERQSNVRTTRLNNESYKHSEETKKKISMNNGSNRPDVNDKIRNTILGRVWIKKENNSKQIDKDELDFYISNGWVRGRIVIGYKQKLQVEVLKQSQGDLI